jgi:type I restriction enzyme R subunit
MPWRSAGGGEPTLEALIRELLNPAALLEYLRSCMAFEEDERGNIVKKVAGYHQFRAVRKTGAGVIGAINTPDRRGDEAAGKGGVIWHTQGSGKSLTMLMLAGMLVRAAEMANPTVVIVTDRNDLDDQLFDTFAMGRALLRQDPVQADSRDHLRQLLDRASGGVVFTTISKFTEAHGTISERANIVVMADEAHRSQYGFVDGGARMARELAEMVRKMPKLDWTQRESERADLRRKVRRLLAMYGYPPDLSEDATQLVLKQAELSTEYASNAGTDASSEAALSPS